MEEDLKQCQPNLFILGAPKCGTTSLSTWLKKHPQVYGSTVKEPHYYNTDESYRKYTKREDYLRLYQGGEPHKYRLDASAWYLHSREAIPNILADCPEARFLVCLRNPVDMAFSLHKHFVNRRVREPVTSFQKAWELSDERLKGRYVTSRTIEPRYLAYKYSCRIGSQSKRLLQYVPRSRVHFVVLDELKANPQQTLKGVLDFLSLENDVPLHVGKKNVGYNVRSPRAQRILRFGVELKDKLGFENTSFGIGRYLSRLNISRQKTSIDEETRKMLTDYFYEEMKLIWEIVGTEYTQWTDINQ